MGEARPRPWDGTCPNCGEVMVQTAHGNKGAVMCRCPNVGPPKCRTYFILPSPEAPLKEKINVPAPPAPEKENVLPVDKRSVEEIEAADVEHRRVSEGDEPDIVGRLFGKKRKGA